MCEVLDSILITAKQKNETVSKNERNQHKVYRVESVVSSSVYPLSCLGEVLRFHHAWQREALWYQQSLVLTASHLAPGLAHLKAYSSESGELGAFALLCVLKVEAHCSGL